MNPPTDDELQEVLQEAAETVVEHATPEQHEAHFVVGGLENGVTYADYLITVDQALARKARKTVPE